MKCAIRKLRPPTKRHGGKAYLARRIIDLFVPHSVYCEPFLGSGSILLNKSKADREFAGDLDRGLMEMWYLLRQRPEWLIDELRMIDYNEANFEMAATWLNADFAPLRAAGFMIRNRFSRGGLGQSFAWSDRLRGGQPGDVNAWETIKAELPAIAERVRDVEFRNVDACELIRSCDSPGTLTYADPPYCLATRTAKNAYQHEMTDEQHRELLKTLLACRGTVYLSGYRSALYDEALPEWERIEFDLPNHSGQGKTKQRRIECVWTNRNLQ